MLQTALEYEDRIDEYERKCSSCKSTKPMEHYMDISVKGKTISPKTCLECRTRRNDYYTKYESNKKRKRVFPGRPDSKRIDRGGSSNTKIPTHLGTSKKENHVNNKRMRVEEDVHEEVEEEEEVEDMSSYMDNNHSLQTSFAEVEMKHDPFSVLSFRKSENNMHVVSCNTADGGSVGMDCSDVGNEVICESSAGNNNTSNTSSSSSSNSSNSGSGSGSMNNSHVRHYGEFKDFLDCYSLSLMNGVFSPSNSIVLPSPSSTENEDLVSSDSASFVSSLPAPSLSSSSSGSFTEGYDHHSYSMYPNPSLYSLSTMNYGDMPIQSQQTSSSSSQSMWKDTPLLVRTHSLSNQLYDRSDHDQPFSPLAEEAWRADTDDCEDLDTLTSELAYHMAPSSYQPAGKEDTMHHSHHHSATSSTSSSTTSTSSTSTPSGYSSSSEVYVESTTHDDDDDGDSHVEMNNCMTSRTFLPDHTGMVHHRVVDSNQNMMTTMDQDRSLMQAQALPIVMSMLKPLHSALMSNIQESVAFEACAMYCLDKFRDSKARQVSMSPPPLPSSEHV